MSVPRKGNPDQYGYIIVWGREERARSGGRQERRCACTARSSVTKIPTGAGRWVPQVYPTVYLSHR